MTQPNDFQVVPYPRMRRTVSDIGWLSRRTHLIRGLLEVDVTEPRRLLHEHKAATGEAISFTGFLAACVGRAVAADRMVHACRNWRGQLVLFDDVDVALLVERESGGKKFPLAHVLRATDKKTVRQIHEEIRAVQSRPMSGREVQQLRWLTAVPSPLRRLLLWSVMRQPRLRKQNVGTVALTAVGMFGRHGGWGLGAPSHSLSVTVGGIAEKPGVVDGRVAIREYLCLTLEFDHDITDGAPAARFTQCVIDLIESGDGLAACFREASSG